MVHIDIYVAPIELSYFSKLKSVFFMKVQHWINYSAGMESLSTLTLLTKLLLTF